MTVWHWVRHAPTHQKTFVGWRDVGADLSDTAQIERLSASLPDRAVLLSSDLQRSVLTADALMASGRRRQPHEPGLREIDFGDWDGLHYTEVETRDPALSRAFWEKPGSVTAPGGESWDTASARIASAVERLNARHPGEHIIAVAHFGAILTQVQRARGISAYETLAQKIDNYSVTTIDWSGAPPAVTRINHLP